MFGVKKQKVYLEPVDIEKYNAIFNEEKRKLAELLAGYYVAIEHVGSTSIPGLVAKPIIDIAVGIVDFKKIDDIISIMEKEYVFLSDRGEEKRKIFVKYDGDYITHHIHIEEFGKQSWINHVEFRNKLLMSEKLREEYAELKKSLMSQYENERDKYTAGKAAFIQKVIHSNAAC